MLKHDTEVGRFYEVGRGRNRPSVTTILGAVWPRGGLDAWRYRNLARDMLSNPVYWSTKFRDAEFVTVRIRDKMVSPLAERLMHGSDDSSAADRGTRIHELVEMLCKSGEIPGEVAQEERDTALAAYGALQAAGIDIRRLEAGVCGIEPIPYAGTADIVCKLGDEWCIVDLKFGRRMSRSWAAQVAAYAQASHFIQPDEEGELVLVSKPICSIGLVLHVVDGIPRWYKIDMDRGASLWSSACEVWKGANSSSPVMREWKGE